MRGAAGLALVAAFAGGCGAAMPGGAGDDTPLTGLTHNVEAVPFSQRWRLALAEGPVYRLRPHELGTPAYSSTLGRVVVGTADGEIVCANSGNGQVVWRKSPGGAVSSSPLFDGNHLLLGTDDGQLLSLDVSTGETVWKYTVQGAVQQKPVLSGDLAIFVDGTNSVYAVNRLDGTWRWQYRRPAPADFALNGEARPTVSGNTVFTGFSDGHVVALDARDGAVLWTRDLAPEHDRFQDVDAAPAVIDGTLFVASAATGVYALKPADGTVIFTVPASGITRMAIHDGGLILSLDRGAVWRMSTKGAVEWTTHLPGGAPYEAIGFDGVLGVSVRRGSLYFLRARDGRPLQHFRPGLGVTTAPAADADGSLFMLSNGGILYAYGTGPGTGG